MRPLASYWSPFFVAKCLRRCGFHYAAGVLATRAMMRRLDRINPSQRF